MRRKLLLDAGALIALSRGDGTVRAVMEEARERGYEALVPTLVVAQVHRGGRHQARTDRVFGDIDRFVATNLQTTRRAGELLARAGMSDAVDAIVAAEALGGEPAMILTSDANDLARLVEAGPGSRSVEVVGI